MPFKIWGEALSQNGMAQLPFSRLHFCKSYDFRSGEQGRIRLFPALGRHRQHLLWETYQSYGNIQGSHADRLRLKNFFAAFQPIFYMETDRIPDIFQSFLVGIAL